MLSGACTTVASRSIAHVEEKDWIEFGASVNALPETERRALHTRILREFEENHDDDSAISLAIIALNQGGAKADYEAVLSRLNTVGSVASDDGNIDIIRFIQPIVERLVAQQRSLEAEIRERELLREQLDALKELEEQLNADGSTR